MSLLDKYLIYSSIFALFTEAFFFHFVIDIKLYYVILLSNFFILASTKKITIHKNLIFIIGFFLIHGAISYLLLLSPIQLLIAQILGISLSSIYYHNLLKFFSVKKLFAVYLDFSFYIAIISILTFYLNINSFSEFRLNGIMQEPAHYAAIMLPATYYFLRNKKYLRLFILVITIFLSKSSIGFIGLGLIVILPLIKVKHFLKYSWLVILLLSCSVFYISTVWNEAIDENTSNPFVRKLKETNKSLSAVFTGKFEKNTNLSSYAFLSNAFIVREIFLDKPLGAGLGSYRHEYEKYFSKMTPPPYLISLNFSKINKTDANSLFLRMIADLGIFSFLFFTYFIYRSFKLFKSDKKIEQQSVFFYLTLKLIREGHYFPPEFYFFLLIFLKNSNEDITCS
ncbi:O-antigen ligase family protein [Polaribacter sp. Asnod1-A03]|uniref:O-antigen ligase family protein n=1 Tax=Polaribacter sp. Asnod1-A03 TaxID=3160581 RepID=UPI0038705FA3